MEGIFIASVTLGWFCVRINTCHTHTTWVKESMVLFLSAQVREAPTSRKGSLRPRAQGTGILASYRAGWFRHNTMRALAQVYSNLNINDKCVDTGKTRVYSGRLHAIVRNFVLDLVTFKLNVTMMARIPVFLSRLIFFQKKLLGAIHYLNPTLALL